MSYDIKNLPHNISNKYKQTINFNDSSSFGYMDKINLDNGLFCIRSDIVFKNTSCLDIIGRSKHLLFNFIIDGETTYETSQKNVSLQTSKDSTVIVADNNSIGRKIFKRKSHLKSVQIILDEKYLKNSVYSHDRILEYFQENDFVKCVKHKKIDTRSKINILDILNINFTNNFDKFHLQSKVFDILYTEFNELFLTKQTDSTNVNFSNYDIKALKQAKYILMENMKNPPSILELAKIIRLNEFKLKVGFKKFFNTTPYKFLFDYKMSLARKLLETGELNINEVSSKIGYKSASSFTTAFGKKFGVNPKDIKKHFLSQILQ